MRKLAAESLESVSWKQYTDSGKDLPMAATVEELKAQFKTISEYHDRNPAQIEYLQQKAAVRWEMNVADQQGVSDELYGELARAPDGFDFDDWNPFLRRAYPANTAALSCHLWTVGQRGRSRKSRCLA